MKTQDQLSLGLNLKTQRDNQTSTFIAKAVRDFEVNRFGLMALFMVLQVCVASIAIYYIFQNSAATWQLVMATLFTMFCNAMLIAQAPAKWCLASFYLSLIFNTLIILINL